MYPSDGSVPVDSLPVADARTPGERVRPSPWHLLPRRARSMEGVVGRRDAGGLPRPRPCILPYSRPWWREEVLVVSGDLDVGESVCTYPSRPCPGADWRRLSLSSDHPSRLDAAVPSPVVVVVDSSLAYIPALCHAASECWLGLELSGGTRSGRSFTSIQASLPFARLEWALRVVVAVTMTRPWRSCSALRPALENSLSLAGRSRPCRSCWLLARP